MPQTAIDADVDEFLDAMRSWSPANRANAAGVFNRFTRWLAERDTIPARATRRQCRDYLDHVAHTPMAARPGRPATSPKSSTVQVHWRQLRAFYAWAQTPRTVGGLGLAVSPMDGVQSPRVTTPVVRAAKLGEVEAMFAHFDRTFLGRRDAAMLSIMFHNGLRVGELPWLDLAGYRVDGDRAMLEVPRTKTDRARDIPVDPTAQKYLRRWLNRRGNVPGPLFIGDPARTTDIGGRLTATSIRRVIDRCAERADVPVSSHQLRRAFVVAAKQRGMSDATICHICGWTDTRMMMRYLADERTTSATDDFYRAVETPRLRAVGS